MDTEGKKSILIHAAYYGMIAGLAVLFIRYLLPPLAPFVAGFVIAWLLHKPAKALGAKMRLHYSFPAFALGVVFYLILFVAVLIAGGQVISALEHFVPQIPVIYANQIVPVIVDVIDRLSQEVFSFLQKGISNLSLAAVRLASSIITGLPSVILSVILMVVSTFFISMDFEHIVSFCKGLLPKRTSDTLSEAVNTGVSSVRKILGSYILIMLMSFMELSIGFLLLKIPYAVGIALLVSVIDIMPVLGTGLVLIPWAIIAAVLRNFPMAAGVAALYIIMLVVRNIVEPKLVGKQMGLHPVATLISMFLGLNMYGILGLFGFPIALSLYIKLAASRRENMKKAASAD